MFAVSPFLVHWSLHLSLPAVAILLDPPFLYFTVIAGTDYCFIFCLFVSHLNHRKYVELSFYVPRILFFLFYIHNLRSFLFCCGFCLAYCYFSFKRSLFLYFVFSFCSVDNWFPRVTYFPFMYFVYWTFCNFYCFFYHQLQFSIISFFAERVDIVIKCIYMCFLYCMFDHCIQIFLFVRNNLPLI